MPYIDPILHRLDARIYIRSIREPYLASDSTIRLAAEAKTLHEHTILIGEEADVLRALSENPATPHITAVVTETTEQFDVVPYSRQAENILATDAQTLAVYAHFLQRFHVYHIWRSRLNNAFTYADEKTLLPALSQVAGCAVYVYSDIDHILMDYSTLAFRNAFTEYLKRRRSLPVELTDASDEIKREDARTTIYGRFSEGYAYALHRMTDIKGYSILVLLVYAEQLSIGIPPDDFLYITAGMWERHLDFRTSFHRLPPPTTCDRLLEGLIGNTLTDPYMISEMMRTLEFPLKRYVGFIYIVFPEAENPALYLRSLKEELQGKFPGHNIGYCEDAIVTMTTCDSNNNNSQEEYFFRDGDENWFPNWLAEKQAYAGVSAKTQYWEKLRTLLLLAKQTCMLGSSVHTRRAERLFSFARMHTYQVIDLCAKAFRETYGHDDIVYLTHPAVVRLTRYDEQNGTNLRGTLFYYLLHGCNVNETAAVMFMHRNTVRNQMQKIVELTAVDLSDAYFRMNLLLSCCIVLYYEDVLEKELRFGREG